VGINFGKGLYLKYLWGKSLYFKDNGHFKLKNLRKGIKVWANSKGKERNFLTINSLGVPWGFTQGVLKNLA